MSAEPNSEERLYRDLAWIWPIVSPPEEYVEEASRFQRAILAHSQIPVRTLLDLGCGGGHNDFNLKSRFEVSGVDLSADMLALARRLNPEVETFQGDLRSVRLGRQFDAVMIADSIDYMLTEDDLRAAFETAYVHLRPGGVFCTVAEQTCETFEQNNTFSCVESQGEVEIAYLRNDYDPDPADTTFDVTFIYLIRQAGQLSIEKDQHCLGLFSLETWTRLLAETGFETTAQETENGEILFTALKPLAP